MFYFYFAHHLYDLYGCSLMENHLINEEKKRILKEYDRRRREIPSNRYAIWNSASMQMCFSRERQAIKLLHNLEVFPNKDSKCLEVGYGSLGWLGTLIKWGVKEENIYGIELDEKRAAMAKEILPKANLYVGDGCKMPFESGFFDLVVVSTVFTSILEMKVKQALADEIIRVMKKGGALLYYDFAFNNPANKNVKGVKKKEIRALFSDLLQGKIKRVTLAPPICRIIAPVSFTIADIFEKVPFLRTHYIAVLVKKG